MPASSSSSSSNDKDTKQSSMCREEEESGNSSSSTTTSSSSSIAPAASGASPLPSTSSTTNTTTRRRTASGDEMDKKEEEGGGGVIAHSVVVGSTAGIVVGTEKSTSEVPPLVETSAFVVGDTLMTKENDSSDCGRRLDVDGGDDNAVVNDDHNSTTATTATNIISADEEEEEEDEEELECRVCRGPAEPPAHPLFAPCKCSGSIGFIHQECLVEWLASPTRPSTAGSGSGTCELCSTPFVFEPRYADGAPEVLPPYEVILGVGGRFYKRILPLGFRVLVAATLWIGALPLLSAYLYYGWLHRPSSVVDRLGKWDLLVPDAISGAVVCSVIVVSFLSLMSFADFLRFHWAAIVQHQELQQDNPQNNNNLNRNNANRNPNAQEAAARQAQLEEELEEELVDEEDDDDEEGPAAEADADLPEGAGEFDVFFRFQDGREEMLARRDGLLQARNRPAPVQPADLPHPNANNPANAHAAQNRGEGEAALQEALGQAAPRPPPPRAENPPDRFEPRFEPIAPIFPNNNDNPNQRNAADNDAGIDPDEDEINMEIHLALDELLGLRGPLPGLVRNLLWFLAFNTTYLGLFAFIPHSVGSIAFRALSSSRLASSAALRVSLVKYAPRLVQFVAKAAERVQALNEESERLNVILRLPDVAAMVLGYLTVALTVFVWQTITVVVTRSCAKRRENSGGAAENAAQEQGREEGQDGPWGGGWANRAAAAPLDDADARGVRRMAPIDEAADAAEGHLRWNRDRHGVHVNEEEMEDEDLAGEGDDDDEEDQDGAGVVLGADRFSAGLNCAAAIVKVGVLLFLKMLLLPLFLGIGLDAATVALFHSNVDGRILYAGGDLFGATLLHWVAGITFMLLVTVSVLQLREVAHPDLFAGIIRPQEPQPDLLGNLLQENGITHTKRMLVSLGIYVALLAVHVWLPARILAAAQLGQFLPFVKPRMWHIFVPQLQVPVELLVFHLSMLAFLEKYKNSIGRMQHHWLLGVCDKMGLTDHVLPRNVKGFVLLGTRRVCTKAGVGDATAAEPSLSAELPDSATNGEGPSNVTSTMTPTEGQTIDSTSNGDKIDNEDATSRPTAKSDTCRHGADSFWKELSGMKTPSPDFIVANLEELTPAGKEDTVAASVKDKTDNFDDAVGRHGKPKGFEVGVTRRSGKRVLPASPSVLRLPAADTAEKPIVVPSSIAEYRFRERRTKEQKRRRRKILSAASGRASGSSNAPEGNGIVPSVTPSTGSVVVLEEEAVIEVWREVAGPPISRPPEGWDDLDVGGAEVQGRWAWGGETRSETEEGVAQRLPFRRCRGSRIMLLVKLVTLLLLSWIAILFVVCAAMSGPLMIGRAIFSLLNVSEGYMHDPSAFAIGVALLVPIVGKAGRVLLGEDAGSESSWCRFRRWVSHRPYPRSKSKVRVIATSSLLWFFLVPMLVGFMYDLSVVKSRSWWAGQEDAMTGVSGITNTLLNLGKTWASGAIFIHIWAFLCYHDVFGKRFWINIGLPMEENARAGNEGGGAPDAAAGRGGAARAEEDAGGPNANTDLTATQSQNHRRWQGKDGRINQFARVVYAVYVDWEWEKVDRVVLLDDFVKPITEQLFVSLVASLLLFFLQHAVVYYVGDYGQNSSGVVLPFAGFVERGTYRMVAFRICGAFVVVSQLAMAFRDAICVWFKAAHKAARDDRYLVGKTLKNYVSDKAKTAQ